MELAILTISRSDTEYNINSLHFLRLHRYDLLWSRKEFLKSLKNRLESIGKTALTCYLIQSVISTFIFCGFGLGLYGHLIE